MMDMVLEKTVEPISFTQGKELKLLSMTDLVQYKLQYNNTVPL